MAESSRVQVRYVEETTFGTTPASALTNLRATGFRLKRNTQGAVSQELRSDRQIPDWVRTGIDVSGEIPFELVYGNLDAFLEGAFSTDWTTNTGFSGTESGTDILRNGTTAKSYTVEAEFASITQFHTFKGCRVDTLSLAIIPGEIITGTVGFQGKLDTIQATTAGTGSATAAPTNDPMNGVDHVSAITEGGATIELLGINLSLANNLRMRRVLGTLSPDDIGYGRFVVTGDIRLYFADATMLTKYMDQTRSNLHFTLTDVQGNAYAIRVDELKYTDADLPVDGNDADVVVTLPFQGLYDSTTTYTIRLTRNPA
jgi:hypothetical protein